MTVKEFKKMASTMTQEQKKAWLGIHCILVSEVNDAEFKTCRAYNAAMRKVYKKSIAEYEKLKL